MTATTNLDGARLGIPARVVSTRRPFWHRPNPLIAVEHIDPGHRQLSAHFPDSWQHLVRAKTLLDGATHVEAPQVVPPSLHHGRIAPLLAAAAQELTQFADAEEARAAGGQARAAAARLRHYVREAQWPAVALTGPQPGAPWLYCGPLNTWAMHATRTPLGLLVSVPRPGLQREPDAVDAGIGTVQAVVSRVLGGRAQSAAARPAMRITDLVLAGGEFASGHKNFAHFFPLEVPAATAAGAEFTVVFSNVHAHRLARCSLELLRSYLREPARRDAAEVLRASIRWFRGHDLAHFWRLGTPVGGDRGSLSHFERMTLEETYADVLGVISATALPGAPLLGQAFAAELLRYLSRDYAQFADSAAAVLTVGWLRAGGVTLDFGDRSWLPAAIPALEELGRVAHRVLWEGSEADIPALRAAIQTGREFRDSLSGLFLTVPTDLDYTFG